MKKIFNANLLSGFSALLIIGASSVNTMFLCGTGNRFVSGYVASVMIALMCCVGIYFTTYNQVTTLDRKEKLKYSIISNLIGFGLVYIYLIILIFLSLTDIKTVEVFYSIFIILWYCGILLSIFIYQFGKQMGTYLRFLYALIVLSSLILITVPAYDPTMIELINFNVYSKIFCNLILLLLSLNWFLIFRKSYMSFISHYKSLK